MRPATATVIRCNIEHCDDPIHRLKAGFCDNDVRENVPADVSIRNLSLQIREERNMASVTTQRGTQFALKWYGERGIVNAIVVNIAASDEPLQKLSAMLNAIQWASGQTAEWATELI